MCEKAYRWPRAVPSQPGSRGWSLRCFDLTDIGAAAERRRREVELVGSPWNSISYKTLGGCLALLLLAASASHAPVEIEKQIEDLTTRIGKDPKNAALYLRRGELYRVHRDWGAALEDYKRAAKLDPSLSAVDLCLARMRLESGQPGEARIAADRFLQARPEHIEGLVTRARALVKLGEGRLAADDLTRAIALCRPPKSPLPEYLP